MPFLLEEESYKLISPFQKTLNLVKHHNFELHKTLKKA